MSMTSIQLLAGERHQRLTEPVEATVCDTGILVSYPFLLTRAHVRVGKYFASRGHATYEPAPKRWRFWPDADKRIDYQLRDLLNLGFDIDLVSAAVGAALLRDDPDIRAIVGMLHRESLNAMLL